MTRVVDLACEFRFNPLGIDVTRPRLSWRMETNRQGARQVAYRVLVASSQEKLRDGSADLWDSGRVESDQSAHVLYNGKPLISRQIAHWNATVWDENGAASQSEPAGFEMGLLDRNDWRASWISAGLAGGPRSTIPAPLLRKPFQLSGPPVLARLYVTALGLYECSINGQPVGHDVFTPGWTDYHQRVQYAVYDVTPLINQGFNAIGAVLGDGWAVGHIASMHRQQYADQPRLFAQLEVLLADGNRVTVVTDATWKTAFGPILHNDMIMGEAYDARRERPGWDTSGFDDTGWSPVCVHDETGVGLVATNGPTVRRIEELAPVAEPDCRISFNRRRCVFDMGQNMVGRVRFKGSAPAGTTVTFRYAEVLAQDGSLYTANLRSARATDYYTFKGDGEEVWEPKFTFHGFRYVEIDGYWGEVSRDTITGIVLHSDMPVTGEFTCSDPLVNQLQRNIVWSQKGNFVDVPTDCPQRDERLGWTGDIQVFLSTAAFNMGVGPFMTRWLRDLSDAQSDIGEVPSVVPYVPLVPRDGGPAWADAAIICPWTLYLVYGDTRVLEASYGVMTRFMDFLLATSPGLIRCAPDYKGWPGFGDWLSINASTPRDFLGTAFLAYDAALMAKIATVLGRTGDAERYRILFEDVKNVFAERYLAGGTLPAAVSVPSEERKRMDDADRIAQGLLESVDYGPIQSGVFNTALFTPTQTAYVLALHFDLLPAHLRSLAVAELVADIERRDMHLSTGFIGSPYLNHVLSANGRLDIAYELLRQTSWPSWLYAVTKGATTIWERWDGWTDESGFQTPEMNSFNHYAYGAIGAWLYTTIAGIQIDEAQPGYKHIILRPMPGGGLTEARGKLNTLYGEVQSHWKIEEDSFLYDVVIPANSSATVFLPVQEQTEVTVNGVSARGRVHEIQAGKYRIVSPFSRTASQ